MVLLHSKLKDLVGLLLSCIVSQDNEGVASGADDAGDAERRRSRKYETENGGNMKGDEEEI